MNGFWLNRIYFFNEKANRKKKSTPRFLYYFLNYAFVCAYTYKYKCIKKSENDILLLITTTFRIRSAGVKLEAGVKTD